MILTDIFESAESPELEANRLISALRKSAADERYAITLDSAGTNASNGFPLVRAAGTWFGGVMLPRGGESKESTRLLGINHRAKAWLKSVVAPSLEKLIAAGREVRISPQSNGKHSKDFHEGVPIVAAGAVAATLLANAAEIDYKQQKRLAVYWWVSTAAEAVGKTTVNLMVSYHLHGQPARSVTCTFVLPRNDARDIVSNIIELRIKYPGRAALLAKQIAILAEPDVPLDKNLIFSIGVGIHSVSNKFKRIDTEAALEIIRKFV